MHGMAVNQDLLSDSISFRCALDYGRNARLWVQTQFHEMIELEHTWSANV